MLSTNTSGEVNIRDLGKFRFLYLDVQKPPGLATFTLSVDGSRERAWTRINDKRNAAIAASECAGKIVTSVWFQVKVCEESPKGFCYKDGNDVSRQRAWSAAIAERDAAQLRQGSTNGKSVVSY